MKYTYTLKTPPTPIDTDKTKDIKYFKINITIDKIYKVRNMCKSLNKNKSLISAVNRGFAKCNRYFGGFILRGLRRRPAFHFLWGFYFWLTLRTGGL